MKELQRHLDAFELYLSYKMSGLNVEDTIKLLMSDLGVTRKTLYKWKKDLKWDIKETIRSIDINKDIQKTTNKSVQDNRIQYLGIYHKLLTKLDKDGYPIEIKNVSDLDKVIKGSLLVQDEPTEHVKETNDGMSEFANVLKESREAAKNRTSR